MHNLIILVGALGKDPEMRYTPSGQAVTSFSVATSRQYTSGNGEQVKETCWWRVSAWGKAAEMCNQYLHKGSKVYIQAHMAPDKATGGPRVWTRQDGSAGASYEVTMELVRFLTPKGEMTAVQEPHPHENEGSNDQMSPLPPEDDIPF